MFNINILYFLTFILADNAHFGVNDSSVHKQSAKLLSVLVYHIWIAPAVSVWSQTTEYGTFRQDLGCGKPKQFIFRCAKSFLGAEKCLQAMLRCTLDVRCRR